MNNSQEVSNVTKYQNLDKINLFYYLLPFTNTNKQRYIFFLKSQKT